MKYKYCFKEVYFGKHIILVIQLLFFKLFIHNYDMCSNEWFEWIIIVFVLEKYSAQVETTMTTSKK